MQKSTILFTILLIAGVSAAPAPEPLLLEIVSGFTNLIATTATTAIQGFTGLVGGAVTALSKIATGLVNVATNMISTCLNIKLSIIKSVANFFTTTLAGINDTLVRPLLKSAETTFNNIATDVGTAIGQLQNNITTSLTSFSNQLNTQAANATNFVTNLVTELQTLLGNAGSCYDTYEPAVQGLAESFIPYVASCVDESSFNVSNIANNATVIANQTQTLVNNLVAGLSACVSPVLASPNVMSLKLTAMTCLNNAIAAAATNKIALLNNVANANIKLGTDIANALVRVGQCFGDHVYESLVAAKMIKGFIVDCLANTN